MVDSDTGTVADTVDMEDTVDTEDTVDAKDTADLGWGGVAAGAHSAVAAVSVALEVGINAYDIQ